MVSTTWLKSLLPRTRVIHIATAITIFFVVYFTFTIVSLVPLTIERLWFLMLEQLPDQDNLRGLSNIGTGTLTEPGYIHVLIPASHPDQNLCKTVLSAGVLGYPVPVLINWQKQFDDSGLVEGGSHLGKIYGINEHLKTLDSSRDADLVLMVDAYDIWFQLRPQTLIDRYFDQNRRANQRIREEIGTDVVDQHNISQQIIFSCQKRCWPWSEDDPPCYAVPQSTLSKDIYGPQTDTDIGDEKNPYIKYRQRFLNSGVAVGTVSAMRKLFTEATMRAEEDGNFGSDQHIFSRLFGEQEVLREFRRQQSMNGIRRLTDGFIKDERHRKFSKEHLNLVKDRDVEFGLGVDYESSIGLATVYAEEDTEWLTLNDKKQSAAANNARDIPIDKSRIGRLSKDIASTRPPFWTFGQRGLPRKTTWSEVPLFTDVWTGIAPTIIHHNAHRDGLKSLRESQWHQIWFQEHARELYNAHITDPLGPIAVSEGKQWWSGDDWKGGARYDAGAWLRYEDICTGTEDEVFRDDMGPWTLPDDH